MRQPTEWPKAASSSFSFLLVMYLLVVSVAYRTCGDKAPDELMKVLDGNAFKSVIGIAMVLHLIVTYTIMQQVLTRAICLRFVPRALSKGASAHTQWFIVSTILMALAWIIANTVPLFSDIVSITGNFLCAQLFPCNTI